MRLPPRLIPLAFMAALLLPRLVSADDKAISTAKRLAAESAGRTAVQKIKDATTAQKLQYARASAQVAQLTANLAGYTGPQIADMRSKWASAAAKLNTATALQKSARIHEGDASATHMIFGNFWHKAGQYNDVGTNPVIRGSKWHFDQATTEYNSAKTDALNGTAKVTEAKDLLNQVQAILGPI